MVTPAPGEQAAEAHEGRGRRRRRGRGRGEGRPERMEGPPRESAVNLETVEAVAATAAETNIPALETVPPESAAPRWSEPPAPREERVEEIVAHAAEMPPMETELAPTRPAQEPPRPERPSQSEMFTPDLASSGLVMIETDQSKAAPAPEFVEEAPAPRPRRQRPAEETPAEETPLQQVETRREGSNVE